VVLGGGGHGFHISVISTICILVAGSLTKEVEGSRAGPTQRLALLARREWPSRVWSCTWWTVHAACPDGPHHLPQSGGWSITKCEQTPPWATSFKEGMAWYSSRPMSSLWAWRPNHHPRGEGGGGGDLTWKWKHLHLWFWFSCYSAFAIDPNFGTLLGEIFKKGPRSCPVLLFCLLLL
jgi:hypothetical protein